MNVLRVLQRIPAVVVALGVVVGAGVIVLGHLLAKAQVARGPRRAAVIGRAPS